MNLSVGRDDVDEAMTLLLSSPPEVLVVAVVDVSEIRIVQPVVFLRRLNFDKLSARANANPTSDLDLRLCHSSSSGNDFCIELPMAWDEVVRVLCLTLPVVTG